jgi:hypothetical protein
MDIKDGIKVLANEQPLVTWTRTPMAAISKGDIVRWQKTGFKYYRTPEYFMGLVLTEPEHPRARTSGIMDVRVLDNGNPTRVSVCAGWDCEYTFEVASVPA